MTTPADRNEAGHIFFKTFGDFVQDPGGALVQLIVPGVFLAYFHTVAEPESP